MSNSALDFLKRCPLLRIEDLIPLLPDFITIDAFRTEICSALETYSLSIDTLRTQMTSSSATASRINSSIAALNTRFAIVESGEPCRICGMPLLARLFYVFPCQHGFHGDCLGTELGKRGGVGKTKRIRELQEVVSQGGGGKTREKAVKELDRVVGASW